jgi:hypothetical protein
MKSEEEVMHKVVGLYQELEVLSGRESHKYALNPIWAQREVLRAKIEALIWTLWESDI